MYVCTYMHTAVGHDYIRPELHVSVGVCQVRHKSLLSYSRDSLGVVDLLTNGDACTHLFTTVWSSRKGEVVMYE